MGMQELGRQLLKVRQMKSLSLNSVAEAADISPAYLQRLERGSVKAPSPPVLQRLARALQLSYPKLMEEAGYLEPHGEADTTTPNLLAHALMAEELTPEEASALVEYLAFHRYRHQRRPAGG